ncbi:MAG: tetratricopeptide repeat protein [Xanthobacteraceae bacterium]|jgi:tetratricopeptide (TPR) repeat protein
MANARPMSSGVKTIRMTRTAAVATGAALLLVAAVALAQSSEDNSKCLDLDNASKDEIIAGCTAVIQFGGLSGRDLAAAYFSRGVAYNLKSQPDAAIKDLDQVLKLTPDDSTAIQQRAGAYFSKGDFDHALADVDQWIRLEPNDFQAYNNRATIHYALGQWEKAVADFTVAIGLNPKVALIYYSRAFALDKLGRHERAMADYTEAIRLDPSLKNRH